MVGSHIMDAGRVLGGPQQMSVQFDLQTLFFFGHRIGHKLATNVPIIKLIRKPRQDFGRTNVNPHIQQIRPHLHLRVSLEKGTGQLCMMGIIGMVVVEENSVVLVGIHAQDQIVLDRAQGRRLGADALEEHGHDGGCILLVAILVGL
jgi:hypothetical protein